MLLLVASDGKTVRVVGFRQTAVAWRVEMPILWPMHRDPQLWLFNDRLLIATPTAKQVRLSEFKICTGQNS